MSESDGDVIERVWKAISESGPFAVTTDQAKAAVRVLLEDLAYGHTADDWTEGLEVYARSIGIDLDSPGESED